MHSRQPVPDALARLSELQGGVVSREQAIAHGFGPSGLSRLVRQGHWTRLAAGIYRTAPGRPDWLALAWAGVLIGGDAARLGGLAAAYLHGLVPEEPEEIEVLLPVGGGPRSRSGPWRFRRERAGARQAKTVGGPPRLTVEDTVLDLVASAGDAAAVVHWVTTAVQSRLTTADRLRRAAAGRRALGNRELLTRALGDVAAGARSPLEVDYLRDVERAHGLPRGVRQARQRGTEVDVWYAEFALLTELDGRRGHTGTGRFKDMRRDNAAAVQGLVTLRFGWADVRDNPCAVAMQVATVLRARGWTGMIQPCPRCRRAQEWIA